MSQVECKITAAIIVINEKIAKLEAQRKDLQDKRDAAALVADVAAGFTVTFKVGRADTRREVEGVVLGRGEVKGVDSVRVQSGEGFELEVHTVKVAELLSIKAPGNESTGQDATPASGGDEKSLTELASDDILSSVLG